MCALLYFLIHSLIHPLPLAYMANSGNAEHDNWEGTTLDQGFSSSFWQHFKQCYPG